MKTSDSICRIRVRSEAGFTLTEVLISVFVAALSLGGIIYAYILAAHQTEWAANSSAAQLMAMEQLERVRAARWDPLAYPPVDDLKAENFPPTNRVLNLPQTGTNVLIGTNVTTITTISNGAAIWKMIRVDCSWGMTPRGSGATLLVTTNTLITYRAPDG